MMYEGRGSIEELGVITIIGVAVGVFILHTYFNQQKEEKEVIPSKLEIKVNDLNKDKKEEPYLIDNKQYEFKTDANEKPFIQPYETFIQSYKPQHIRMNSQEPKN